MDMARHKLADVATMNQRIEQISRWDEWNELVKLTQDTLERVSE